MGEKILVIDDEPHLVEIIANRLRANRFEVVTAIAGNEGLEKAKQERPRLILLDILMSDMDGYQVLRRLKELPETQDIPVIMFTVKKWSEDVQRALGGGAVDYIMKPFSPDMLLEKIKRVLQHGKENTRR